MRETLIEQLKQITPEEERLLAGGVLDRGLYTLQQGFTVDRDRLLGRGKLIAVRPHTRFVEFPAHSHNYIEIMYMCSGQTVHTINGGPPLTLRAGELLFLNQQAQHQVARAEMGDVGVNFIVLPAFFDYALELAGTDNVLGAFLLGGLRRGGGEISSLHFKVAGAAQVQNLVENLLWSLVESQPNARRITQATMGLLLLQLLNHVGDLSSRGEMPGGVVLAALREIEENYREADLTRLAEEKHVSLSYLSSAVRQATGHTFKDLLREKRLAKAVQLLRETRLSVEDIIAAVGYENTSYFYRRFRERYGVSPKEYRAGLQSKDV